MESPFQLFIGVGGHFAHGLFHVLIFKINLPKNIHLIVKITIRNCNFAHMITQEQVKELADRLEALRGYL
jgi:hypothetical protein